MKTRYICTNGHNQPAPGRKIGLLADRPIYECVVVECRAEAEPVTVPDTAEEHIRAGHTIRACWTVEYGTDARLTDDGRLIVDATTAKILDGTESETFFWCVTCEAETEPETEINYT